jgi:hypothetical protein
MSATVSDAGISPSSSGYSVDVRLAVLEQIAKDTKYVLSEIKQDLKDIRSDQRADFRLLFGCIVTVGLDLAGLIAHGFHWF